MITYEETPGGYIASYHNGRKMGEILRDVDGFYKWYSVQRPGYEITCDLRSIADKMDELNAPFEKEMNKYFEKNKQD